MNWFLSPRMPMVTIAILVFVVTPALIAGANGCPIAIDLNRDGIINTHGLNTSEQKMANLLMPLFNVSFDLDGKGTEIEKVEWLTGEIGKNKERDGFLLDMRSIDFEKPLTGNNLFGTAGGFEDGFEKLRLLDVNNDGVVANEELVNIAIWQDDGDAVFQRNELRKLAEFGILSLTAVPQLIKGKKDSQPVLTGEAITYGDNYYIEDVWLLSTSVMWDFSRYYEDAYFRLLEFFNV